MDIHYLFPLSMVMNPVSFPYATYIYSYANSLHTFSTNMY